MFVGWDFRFQIKTNREISVPSKEAKRIHGLDWAQDLTDGEYMYTPDMVMVKPIWRASIEYTLRTKAYLMVVFFEIAVQNQSCKKGFTHSNAEHSIV
jgi:hypothetical protein